MKQKIKVHFVCRGNIFRSRVAEARANSLQVPNVTFSSSGIEAAKYPDTISPWALKIGEAAKITEFFSDQQKQTTEQILNEADVIVFMSHDVQRDASELYEFNHYKSLVWNVKDRQDWRQKLPIVQKRARTYRYINRQVLALIRDVTSGSRVDIFDEQNQAQGFSLPITIANKKALWHRGCHALITTPNNHIMVQRRSRSILFSPNLVDVTLGGHVDMNEEPEQALLREIKEEIGLDCRPDQIELLSVHKWHSYHKRSKRHNKAFMYIYHVKLDTNDPTIVLQQEEVSSVHLLSRRQLNRLLRLHRLPGVGRLNYSYRLYRDIVNQAAKSKPIN